MDEIQIRERVRVGEPATQLLDDVHGDVDRKSYLLFCAAIPNRAKIATFNEIHREKKFATNESGIEHRNQIAVRQLHDNFRFIAESRDVLGVCEMRQNGLDDHHPLETAVTCYGEIERTHATLCQGSKQVILAEFPGVMLPVSLAVGHA